MTTATRNKLSVRRGGVRLARGYAAELYRRARCALSLRGVEQRDPILVHQMGKVGSSTVVSTLHHLGLPSPVLHVHTLSPDHLRHAISRQRGSRSPFLHEHLIVSQVLVRKLQRAPFHCRIVTLTREPIARAVSFVFEDRDKQAPEALLPDGRIDTALLARSIEGLLRGANGTADPTEWFDRELRDGFGVDVFAHPYDFERGYTIIREGRAPLLVIRMEDLNRALRPALSDLLDIDPARLEVVRANVGAEKGYAPYMAEIKETLTLAPDVIERVTRTRYFRHFYAADTDRILTRWAAPSA